MADETNWVDLVAAGRCETCGMVAADVPRGRLGAEVTAEADRLADLMETTTTVRLRHRPAPDVWSALEYAAHVRDVLAVFTDRIGRTRAEDDPVLGWWDHEAAAADEDYNGQDPAVVGRQVRARAAAFGTALAAVPADPDPTAWNRTATRRPGERFTIEGMARFVLHEVRHHRVDAVASVMAP